MKLIQTLLPDIHLLEPDVFGDQRGWFMETWSRAKWQELGLNLDFVQDNHSYTALKGTLRGLHFQNNPHAQAKVVRVLRGRIYDVAVDLRKSSPTYRQWIGVELTAENKKQLFIPRGFAHGFLTLCDDVEVAYKVDHPYDQKTDRSIRFDDPDIGINWGIADPILSDKDKSAPLLRDSDCNFIDKRDL